MSGQPSHGPQGRGLAGAVGRFRQELAREELDPLTATFSDRETEASYQRDLVSLEHPKLKIMAAAAIVIWHLFVFLDLTTIRDGLREVLAIRCLIVGPIMLGIGAVIWSGWLKSWFGELAAAAMFASALGIIAMIAVMPGVGAPPYIIGVLVLFAYGSFFSRMRFTLAAFVYVSISAIYSMLLLSSPKFGPVEVISGHFFMIAMAGMSVFTHYFQELRTRQIWLRNRQRASDESYIQELLIEATAADQSKINFLSVLSHELRTPLHQIIGFSEVIQRNLEETPCTDAGRFADDIRSSAQDLLGQIGKMLRYADATAGRITYDPERLDIAEIVETALTPLRSAAASKSLSIDRAELTPARIVADHLHTCYAVGHIIDNAIKASPHAGRIAISGAPKNGGYRLTVRDFGPGMSAEEIWRSLEPFAQAEQVRSRTFNGLGLGLTLARKIFADQQIEFDIEPAEGGGLQAVMTFELAEPKRAAAG